MRSLWYFRSLRLARMILLAGLVALALAGCLPIPGLFYIGQLSHHDQAIFREAARIEGVDTVNWPVPGAWIVVYGAPMHKNDQVVPGITFVRRNMSSGFPAPWQGCQQDQYKTVTYRHAIGHANGKGHSSNKRSYMHDPIPCWPED